ncbi:MAG: translation elongation factor Ts [Alphaproteobacteria bacterium]|nr:translation elongation factor Ts [Alphaproteobacteria bacterium]MCY4229685.1 translation elongation factor Ts [Alphaproteobacteria bacterium]MCY4320642.1 translation elongation factor Ts [Alphaproteobacteria bacterium]
MVQVTAALVKDLRERTGAGMMDCKKALTENRADIEAAVDWLRKKGLAAAEKKAGRTAAEGLVGMALEDGRGALVELNAETDFVARNEGFQAAVAKLATLGLSVEGGLEALKASNMEGQTAEEYVISLIATIGENMNLRRYAKVEVGDGVVAGYIHSAAAPGLGKIGVLVGLESSGDKDKLVALGKQIAMHVTSANPRWVARDDVDAATIERERAILVDQAEASGRPNHVVEKMVEGRMRKYYEEVVLQEQAFIMDTDKSVGKILEEAVGDIGAPVSCAGFVRFALGEGVAREEKDFAAEVAETLGS